MRRGLRPVAVSSAVALVACNAVLGLRDIEEAAPTLDASSSSIDSATTVDGAKPLEASTDAGVPGEAATDGGATGFCAPYGSALVCDDFESGQFSTRWQLVQEGVTPFAKVSRRNGAVDGGANQHEGYFGFSPIPNDGVSALAIDMASGRRSLRFEVNPPVNGWPSSGVGLARMVDATGKGLRIVAEQSGALWKFAVRADLMDGGSSLVADMGYLVPSAWTCLEIELATDGTLRAWQGSALAVGGVSPSLATTPMQAQVGMIWNSIGNSGSKYIEIDNVVVASGAVGCP